MKYLVVGGAGYIGSHMAKMLVRQGHEVVNFDNLSTGFESAVRYGELVVGDLSDTKALKQLFSKQMFDGVLHFAASSQVGESILNPAKYYRNNVVNTLNLLDVMVQHQVNQLIFSSTAATFGEPKYLPIDEIHPKEPINPYGASKLMIERMLADYGESYGIQSVALRYFNAAGADPEGELGERHDPETHLIPIVLQAASGRREAVTVFGRDYDTEDGTCIRDYIHIEDLCQAHSLALDYLQANPEVRATAFNLGNGQGFSVLEVLDTAKAIVANENANIPITEGARRTGDPARLIADSTKALSVLGWEPKYKNLREIVEHAWAWEKKMI